MKHLLHALATSRLLKANLDHHLMRTSMVVVFLLFGYQKWFEYEAQVLIPYVSNGPLISWIYPAFGIRGGVGSWALWNGYFACFSSGDFGTGKRESLGLSDLALHSWRPLRSFHSCQTDGTRLPGAFPQ